MIPLPVLESYVSAAVGTPIAISCEADATFPADRDGQVFYGQDGSTLVVSIEPVLHVRQSVCDAAQATARKRDRSRAYLLFAGQPMDADAGGALEVLLHEGLHVALNSSDESVVECAAYLNRWAFVRQFKLPAFVSNLLMVGMAWRHGAFPAQYRGVC